MGKRRDANPANKNNWQLCCGACGTQWEDTEIVDLVDGHFQELHPDLDNPNFYLVWVGIGPKPKTGFHDAPQRGPRRGRRR